MSDPKTPADVDALPVNLPTSPVAHARFGHAAIDYSVNKQLQALIPSTAGAVVLDVRLKGGDGTEVFTAMTAIKVDDRWGLVLAGSVDLANRRDYEVEILAVHS